jgi:hypothetical protein
MASLWHNAGKPSQSLIILGLSVIQDETLLCSRTVRQLIYSPEHFVALGNGYVSPLSLQFSRQQHDNTLSMKKISLIGDVAFTDPS